MNTSRSPERHELRQAEILFRRRDFAGVVRALAPQIFLFRSDRRYYYLLGVASLYIGDFSGAHSYLLRGRDLDPLNTDLQLALAVTHLWRKETPDALALWIDIQDKNPGNAKAKKGLEELKAAADKTDWPAQLRLGTLRHLYPEPGFDWHGAAKRAAYAAGGLVTALALVGVVLAVKGAIERRQPPPRPGWEASAADPAATGTAAAAASDDAAFGLFPGEEPRFQLSPAEIKATTNDIQKYFREYRDNPARILINKLIQSNAPEVVKAQLRGLASHFKDPGFTKFRDNAAFAEVVADPRLYAGSYVLWRGRIAALASSDQAIGFNLLVGYDASKVVSGTVRVNLGFAAELHNGDAVELIGQVVATGAKAGFYLQGTAIRMIRGDE